MGAALEGGCGRSGAHLAEAEAGVLAGQDEEHEVGGHGGAAAVIHDAPRASAVHRAARQAEMILHIAYCILHTQGSSGAPTAATCPPRLVGDGLPSVKGPVEDPTGIRLTLSTCLLLRTASWSTAAVHACRRCRGRSHSARPHGGLQSSKHVDNRTE